jgi:type IV pilus assembly protein PilA
MKTQSKKGFTLVEIMIVVVIIGLLAAMAIPAFQKVRTNSIGKTIVNDGRQIGSAAQQYFMEEGASSVAVEVDPDNGEITGPLTDYVTDISSKLSLTDSPITTEEGEGGADGESFTLTHALGAITFNNEGDPTTDDAFGN